MPDGETIVYGSFQGTTGLFRRRADATGRDSQLVRGFVSEVEVSPDGQVLVMRMGGQGQIAGGRDLAWLRLGQDSVPQPLLQTPFDEMAPMLSPDGRFLAYQSDETGTTEIFLRRFPGVDSFKRQVSNGGGVAPLWSRDGRELFYLGRDSQMVAVRVADGTPPTIGEPVPLFRVPNELLQVEAAFHTPWDVTRDGRFIMARRRTLLEATGAPQVVAENWLTELAARVPR